MPKDRWIDRWIDGRWGGRKHWYAELSEHGIVLDVEEPIDDRSNDRWYYAVWAADDFYVDPGGDPMFDGVGATLEEAKANASRYAHAYLVGHFDDILAEDNNEDVGS